MAAQKIASLLASATEIVCALGQNDRLVAISHECDYPPDILDRPRVTKPLIDVNATGDAIDAEVRRLSAEGASLYSIDTPKLAALQPDLIVTQSHCDVCAISYDDVQHAVRNIDALADTDILALNPTTLEGILEDCRSVGDALGCRQEADKLVNDLQARIDHVQDQASTVRADERPRVACIEWIDPLIVAANWIPDLIEIAGGHRQQMTASGANSQYTRWDALVEFDPEVIVIMPCGYDLERAVSESPALTRRDGWSALQAVRRGRVFATDGNAYFNRSGPRLVDSLELLASLIHPSLFEALGEQYAPFRSTL